MAFLPRVEVVGVALAAPIIEEAAALRASVVVIPGNARSAATDLPGQEADLRLGPCRREQGEPRGGTSALSRLVPQEPPLHRAPWGPGEEDLASWCQKLLCLPGRLCPAPWTRQERDPKPTPYLWPSHTSGCLGSLVQRGHQHEQQQEPHGTSWDHAAEDGVGPSRAGVVRRRGEGAGVQSLHCRRAVSACFMRPPTGRGGARQRSPQGRLIHAGAGPAAPAGQRVWAPAEFPSS